MNEDIKIAFGDIEQIIQELVIIITGSIDEYELSELDSKSRYIINQLYRIEDIRKYIKNEVFLNK